MRPITSGKQILAGLALFSSVALGCADTTEGGGNVRVIGGREPDPAAERPRREHLADGALPIGIAQHGDAYVAPGTRAPQQGGHAVEIGVGMEHRAQRHVRPQRGCFGRGFEHGVVARVGERDRLSTG